MSDNDCLWWISPNLTDCYLPFIVPFLVFNSNNYLHCTKVYTPKGAFLYFLTMDLNFLVSYVFFVFSKFSYKCLPFFFGYPLICSFPRTICLGEKSPIDTVCESRRGGTNLTEQQATKHTENNIVSAIR